MLFYGLDSQADVWADEIDSLGLEGITFHLHYQNEILHMKVPLDRAAFCPYCTARHLPSVWLKS